MNTIDVLQANILDLKRRNGELKSENRQLREENKKLTGAIREAVDHMRQMPRYVPATGYADLDSAVELPRPGNVGPGWLVHTSPVEFLADALEAIISPDPEGGER